MELVKDAKLNLTRTVGHGFVPALINSLGPLG